MANVFIPLLVPEGNATGGNTDVSAMGRIKSATIEGAFDGNLFIEISMDGTSFANLKRIEGNQVGGEGLVIELDATAFRARVRRVLDEGAGHVERRAGDVPARDGLADGDALLERSAQIACARHARKQELPRGRRHDHGLEEWRVDAVPISVVRVPHDHEVDVTIP